MKAIFDQRENNIDFVRIVLALLVILSHSYPLTLGHERSEPFMLLSRGQVTGGRIAVDLFFILSGFLISASYERSSSAVSFLRKRVARIYPGIILVSLVTLVLFAPLAHARVEGASLVAKILNVAGNTLRLAEWKYSGAFASNPAPGVINGSLWSIYYEFWCYIGVLALGLTGLLRSKKVLAVLFGASIVVSLLFAYFRWHLSGGIVGEVLGYPPFWARLLPMYLAGVVFYRFRDLIPVSRAAVVDLFAGFGGRLCFALGIHGSISDRRNLSGHVFRFLALDPAPPDQPLRGFFVRHISVCVPAAATYHVGDWPSDPSIAAFCFGYSTHAAGGGYKLVHGGKTVPAGGKKEKIGTHSAGAGIVLSVSCYLCRLITPGLADRGSATVPALALRERHFL